MEIIKVVCFLMVTSLSFAQSELGLKVFTKSNLYDDSLEFDMSRSELVEKSTYGTLFYFETKFIQLDLDVKSITQKIQFYMGDSIIPIDIKGKRYKLFCTFNDSLPHGVWGIYSENNKKVSEYIFLKGQSIFSTHYDESGQIIREITYSQSNNQYSDKWFLNSNLVRYSFMNNEESETLIFYPNGEIMIKYIYSNNGNFDSGIYFDNKVNEIIHIRSRNKK